MNLEDPRISSYAFGELDGPDRMEDRSEVEAFLATSADARAMVAALRDDAAALQDAFAAEPVATLGEPRLERLLEFAADPHLLRVKRDAVYHVITHPVPEPRRFRTNLLALAAAIAIVVTSLSIIVTTVFNKKGGISGGAIAKNPRTPASPRAGDDGLLANGYASQSPRGFIELLPDAPGASAIPANITVTTLSATPTTRQSQQPSAAAVAYALDVENPFQDVRRNPTSTFPFHPQSASYANVRQAVAAGHMPTRGDVRIEEMVNAFAYNYAAPTDGSAFKVYSEAASCPWSDDHRLVRIGVKARETATGGETIAQDLRITVEFNPQQVSGYRLIGFDRHLAAHGATDAAGRAVRAGQAVTALYEVIPATPGASMTEPLRYQDAPQLTATARDSRESMTVTLRYKDNDKAAAPHEQQVAVMDDGKLYLDASGDFRFAAAVASYGMILTDSPNRGSCTYEQVLLLAANTDAIDLDNQRGEFVDLVRRTRAIARG